MLSLDGAYAPGGIRSRYSGAVAGIHKKDASTGKTAVTYSEDSTNWALSALI
jgi:hypothetical protein